MKRLLVLVYVVVLAVAIGLVSHALYNTYHAGSEAQKPTSASQQTVQPKAAVKPQSKPNASSTNKATSTAPQPAPASTPTPSASSSSSASTTPSSPAPSTSQAPANNSPQQLANTGPSAVVAVFSTAAIIGTAIAYTRRLASLNRA